MEKAKKAFFSFLLSFSSLSLYWSAEVTPFDLPTTIIFGMQAQYDIEKAKKLS